MTPQFRAALETYGPRFAVDLGLTPAQVAGIFGNFAVETGQFRLMQEVKPTVKGSRGGWGWAQWTGPRRRAFEAWAKQAGHRLDDPEAFYAYVLVELAGPEKAALAALRRTATTESAVETFMLKYERPGVPHLDKRRVYAREALEVLKALNVATGTWVKPGPASSATKPAPSPAKPRSDRMAPADALPGFAIRGIQQRLIALGYHGVGLVDGKPGPKFSAALRQLQQRASDLGERVSVDGAYGPQTRALLDEANGAKYEAQIAPERAAITARDLARVGTPAVIEGRNITWASVGSILVAVGGFAVDLIQQWQSQPDMPWYGPMLMGFVPTAALPVIVALFNVYNVAKSRGLITSAVERVREGIDNSGAPPAAGPGGLLGSLFGARAGA